MQTTRSERRTARSAARARTPSSVEDWLTRPRTVGTPVHWGVQGAVFGGLIGWLAPPYLILVEAVSQGGTASPIWFFWPLGYAGAALGGAVGLAQQRCWIGCAGGSRSPRSPSSKGPSVGLRAPSSSAQRSPSSTGGSEGGRRVA